MADYKKVKYHKLAEQLMLLDTNNILSVGTIDGQILRWDFIDQKWELTENLTVLANGRISANAGMKADALEGGASLILFPHGGVDILSDYSDHQANFYLNSEDFLSLMTDEDGTFTAANVNDWIIVRSGKYIGAMAQITEVLDLKNVVLHTMGWDFDIDDFGYYIVDHPSVVIGDGFHMEFNANHSGHFDIHSEDWIANNYSNYLFEVELDAGKDAVDGGYFKAEANGYNQVNSLVVDYESGELGPGETGGAVGARIEVTDASTADSSTDVTAYIAVVANGTDANTRGFVVNPGFKNALVVAGAQPADPGFGYDVIKTTATVTDRVTGVAPNGTAFLDASTTNVTLFDAVDDYILIGSAATFEVIEVNLATVSSKNIDATFEYSTGNGTWSPLVVLADGTVGFTKSGQISFRAPVGWAVGQTAEVNGDIANKYYIRITRTRNAAIAVPPVEDHFLLYTSLSLGMTIRGDGTIKPASIADATAPNDSIYYSTTASKLVYKNTAGVVKNLY